MYNKNLKSRSFPIWNDRFKKYSNVKLNARTTLNGYMERLMDKDGSLLSGNDNSSLHYAQRPKVFKPKSVLVTLKKENDERRIETFDVAVEGNESVDIKRYKSEPLLLVQSAAPNKTIGLEEDRLDEASTPAPLTNMLNKIPVIRFTRYSNTLQTVRINNEAQSMVKCKASVNDASQNVNGYEEFTIKNEECRSVSLERKTASNGIQGATRNLPNILRNKSSKGLYKTSCSKASSLESVNTMDDTCNISRKGDYDTQRPLDDTRERLKKSRSKRKQDHYPLDIKQESPKWITSRSANKDSQAEKKIQNLIKTKRRKLNTSPTRNVMERTRKQYYKLDFSPVKVENEARERDVASIPNYLSTNSLESSSTNCDEFLLSKENSMQKYMSDFSSVAAIDRICSDLENADYMNCLNMEEFIMDTDEVHKLLSPTIDGCFDETTYSFIFDANNEKYGINGNNVNQYEVVGKVCSEHNEVDNNNNLSNATVVSMEDRKNSKEFTKCDQAFLRDDLIRLQLAENVNNDNYEMDLMQAIESETENFHNVSTDFEQSIIGNDDCEKPLDSSTNKFHSTQTEVDGDLYLLCNDFDILDGLYIADDKDNLLPGNIDDTLLEDCIYDNDLLRRSDTMEYIENDGPRQYGVRDYLIQSYNFRETIHSLSTNVDKGTMEPICDRNKDSCKSDIDVLGIDDFHSKEFEVRKDNSIISSSWALSNMNEFNHGENKLNSLLPDHFDNGCENNELESSGSSTVFDHTLKQLSGINEEWSMRNENLEGSSTSYTAKKIDGSCVDSIPARNSNDRLNKENVDVGYSCILEDLFWKNETKLNKVDLKLRK